MNIKARQDFLTSLRCKAYFQQETTLESLMSEVHVHTSKQYTKIEYKHLEKAWKQLAISKNELLTLQNTLYTEGIDTAICDTFLAMLNSFDARKKGIETLQELGKESLKVSLSDQFVRFIELSVIAVTSHLPFLSNETTSGILVFIVVMVVSSVGMSLKAKKA